MVLFSLLWGENVSFENASDVISVRGMEVVRVMIVGAVMVVAVFSVVAPDTIRFFGRDTYRSLQ